MAFCEQATVRPLAPIWLCPSRLKFGAKSKILFCLLFLFSVACEALFGVSGLSEQLSKTLVSISVVESVLSIGGDKSSFSIKSFSIGVSGLPPGPDAPSQVVINLINCPLLSGQGQLLSSIFLRSLLTQKLVRCLRPATKIGLSLRAQLWFLIR